MYFTECLKGDTKAVDALMVRPSHRGQLLPFSDCFYCSPSLPE